MKYRELRAKIIRKKWTLAAMLSIVSLALPGAAQADYCYRHITNNRDVLVTLRMCNTHGDCGIYPVAAHSTVPYAIPKDNSSASVEITGEYFRNSSGDTRQTLAFQHWRNEGAGPWEKLFGSGGDFCHIFRLGGETLSDTPWRQALTFNTPSNGDIIVNAEAATTTPYTTNIALTPFTIATDRVANRRENHTFVRMSARDFQGLWSGMTAAVNRGNYTYFFRDGWYMRYDLNENYLSPEYPLRVTDEHWPGLSALGQIDAAVNNGNGKVYFFGGSNYLRYDIASDRADPEYPRRVTEQTWPGLEALGTIRAATYMGNGKIMFFGYYTMLLYDVATDRAVPGYPVPLNNRTDPNLSSGVTMAAGWRPGEQMLFYESSGGD